MEKSFKFFCILISVIIVFSSFFMIIASMFDDSSSDIFGCNDIIENIRNCELNMTSVIYVQKSDGIWEEYQRIHGTENRIWVDVEDMPKQLIDAFVAIEDQRYYKHGGVDWKRTISAFVNYLPFVKLYSSNQGGSTITQQLIKNITSDKEQNAIRKAREIARALLIEKELDKTTILEAYLNTISLGNGICGVQVASNYYFNKDVSELTLAECASLAAITKNPSAYNPESKPENNFERRRHVLDTMLELKKITDKEHKNAYNTEILIDTSQKENFEIPINNYFVDALIDDIIEDLAEKYNCSTDTASAMLYNGGYRIYSTLDTEVQSKMEKVYLNGDKYFLQKSKEDKSIGVQSAMTVMNYNGNIKGIVGGVGEKTVNRGLNRAVDSPRQPGSTMKPLGVYTLGIEKELITYSTIVEDRPMQNYYEDGKPGPKEWYGSYIGNITVKSALERSANTIPCWILKDLVGVNNSYTFLTEKLGLNHLTENDKNLSSLALGGCNYGLTTTESAAAYAIYGNGGIYNEPTTYLKVLDIEDNVVLQPKRGTQVISSTTATIMNRLLQNVVYGSNGTGRSIASYSDMHVYAKTGTSSESNDLWMVAGTPYYVASVWYGFDQPEAVYNSGAAAAVWKAVMRDVHTDLEKRDFNYDDEVVRITYCEHSGLKAGSDCIYKNKGYYQPGTHLKTCKGGHSQKEDSSSSEDIASSSSNSSSTNNSSIDTSNETSSANTSSDVVSSSQESSSSQTNSGSSITESFLSSQGTTSSNSNVSHEDINVENNITSSNDSQS